MSDSKYVQKYTLECARLAAECRNIAGDVRTPNHIRAHFLRMAIMWTDLAVPPPLSADLSSLESETDLPRGMLPALGHVTPQR
jgi:hypothetical protein